ncbi:MAG: hypothetical protein HY877_07715 [Deltaproteobacteria bacterium]|nr:hypothetical protein [Deltaproteobacteria bacterium]
MIPPESKRAVVFNPTSINPPEFVVHPTSGNFQIGLCLQKITAVRGSGMTDEGWS